MKRLSFILACALAALLSFPACDGNGLEGIESFILIGDDPEKPLPVFDGQTVEMQIGQQVLPAYFIGGDGWFGLQSRGNCLIGDPSVLLFYRGSLFAMQGGTSSVTLIYEEHEVHFTVSVPGGASHGTIYFTAYDRDNGKSAEDWEGIIPFSDLLVVNGVLTDKPCCLVSSDSEGNLWQGVSRGGRIYLSCNGRELGENASIENPYPERGYLPKKECIRTRHGRLFYFHGNQYKAISTDGTVKEGTVDGNILDMDINANGDIYLWTWYYMAGHVWIVSPDGTSTHREAGTDHIILGAALDSEGNEYVMCNMGDNKAGIYKNGKAAYNVTEAYNPRLLVHGTDVWVASYSPDEDPDANGNVMNWGVYLVKNKEINHIATGHFSPETIELCMTPGGAPYIMAGDASGHFVYKDTAPVMFIPFSNSENAQLAVTE